jgi:methyltransferase (TIGR00027 family)
MEPVSRTAYYCAGVRAQDAERPHPIVGDKYAKLFLGDEGRAVFERFRHFTRPNASNITRHRIVDDLVRARLLLDAARPVVLLGAGFDSRAYRLTGGRWLELDAAPIITRKEELLPATRCPNPLERVAVDFSPAALREALGAVRGSGIVTVVIEGVLMYLPPPKVDQLLEVLRKALPHHEIICDLMTERFLTRYSADVHRVLAELGAHFEGIEARPLARFREAGFAVQSRTSIPLRAAELRAMEVSPFILRWFLPSLRDGYAVYAMSRGG